jgi:hopanoid C-2 methylase
MPDQLIIPAVETEQGAAAAQPGSLGQPRRILCAFPHYEPSFGSFEYACDITGRLRAFMAPQGLHVIAAALTRKAAARALNASHYSPSRAERSA